MQLPIPTAFLIFIYDLYLFLKEKGKTRINHAWWKKKKRNSDKKTSPPKLTTIQDNLASPPILGPPADLDSPPSSPRWMLEDRFNYRLPRKRTRVSFVASLRIRLRRSIIERIETSPFPLSLSTRFRKIIIRGRVIGGESRHHSSSVTRGSKWSDRIVFPFEGTFIDTFEW